MLWTNSNANTTKDIGDKTEQMAKEYLLSQGLQYQCANYKTRVGEIDLIMHDQNTLVFVEVKYRKTGHYGGAISAVSVQKQHKIKKCAQLYLQQHGINEYNSACRFDVVTLDGSLTHPVINWLTNAFY